MSPVRFRIADAELSGREYTTSDPTKWECSLACHPEQAKDLCIPRQHSTCVCSHDTIYKSESKAEWNVGASALARAALFVVRYAPMMHRSFVGNPSRSEGLHFLRMTERLN